MSDDAQRAFDRWIMTHADSRNMSVIAFFTAGYRARDGEVGRLRGALEEIAAQNFVPLQREAGFTVDETAAKRLYENWAKILGITRAALTQDHGETE